MRKNYLLFVVIMLAASACKKETETVNLPATAVDAPAPCWGNNWELDDLYYGDLHQNKYLSLMPPWVYNNKIYVPDDDAQEVRIYDGVNWQTLASNIDVETYGDITSFTVGSKGYLLHTTSGDLWQYNFVTNTWSHKTDFPGERRFSPTTFTIGSKGYVAGGYNEQGNKFKDVWEYNPVTNAWVRKADLPLAISSATGFTIGNKGYLVTGSIPGGYYYRGLHEYDPITNAWSNKAWFPGNPRLRSIAFVISEKAYVGGGSAGGEQFNDYYRYNPLSNTWITVAAMPVPNNRSEQGFTLNSKGYGVFLIGSDYGMLTYTPQYCAPGSSQGSSSAGAVN